MRWVSLFFLFALDVFSKIAALLYIPPISSSHYPFGGIGIFSKGITFSLNYAVNTGAAWGMFAGYPGLLFATRILIVGGLVGYLLFQKEKRFPFWLIVTGAIGNGLDFCLHGHVIDFLHFTFWGYSFPIFNIADSCITLGVCSLLFFGKKQLRSAWR